jgi:predicted acyltransferase
VIRIPGVLQRIALCYFFASLLYVRLPAKSLIAVTAGLLVSYWFLIKGDLTPAGNLGAVIDRMIFHGHMYTSEYDPEGLLSTLPAIATALIGVLTGEFLARPDEKPTNKACGMFAAGVMGVIAGQIWNIWFPINKALWTGSYVLFTAGLGLVLLSLLYWLIEIKNIKMGWKFFVVYGVNGLLAYALPLFFLKTLNRIDAPNADGTVGNLRLFFTRHAFESWTTPMNASLCFALAHVLLWYLIFSALYKRKIFVKI